MNLLRNNKQMYFVPAKDWIMGVDYEVVTDTDFYEEHVSMFVKVLDHEYNEKILSLLGLGVIRSLHEKDDYYLYYAAFKNDKLTYLQEHVAFESYYLITHPTYENSRFEEFFQKPFGKLLLKMMFEEDTEIIYSLLLKRFKVNKGNVLPFRKR